MTVSSPTRDTFAQSMESASTVDAATQPTDEQPTDEHPTDDPSGGDPSAGRATRVGRWSTVRARLRRIIPDLLVAGGYTALAGYLTGGLWADPHRRVLSFLGGADPILAQWWLAHAAHIVAHRENPFFTTDLNAPLGVDLAGNASFLGVGIPLAPLTWLLGAEITALLVIMANFVLTGLAWYWLFSRHLGLNRAAAGAGGLFCAFAPPLILVASQGEQHVTAGFVIPFIVWRFTRVGVAGRPVRDGILLGLLIAWQALIGEEVLLLTALAVGVFALAYTAQRPRQVRAMIPALARGYPTAILVTAVLLAVPLWYQFFGPQHYHGTPIDPQGFHDNLIDYFGLPAPTRFWSAAALGPLAVPTPYLGLPLALILLAFSWPLRHRIGYTTTLAVLAIMLLFSLGTDITVRHRSLGIPGPWILVAHLPVFRWAIPTRIGTMVIPAAGAAIAYLLDHAITGWRAGNRLLPATAILTTTTALLIFAPPPLPTMTWAPTPHFVTAGTWRGYVPPGRSLVTVPAPALPSFDGMRWAVATRGDITLPGGYFLGPNPQDNGKTTLFGTAYRFTTTKWNTVLDTGQVWQPAPGDRDRLLNDLRFWKASVLVLVPTAAHAEALRASVEQFLGPPQRVDDVWLWDVRGLV